MIVTFVSNYINHHQLPFCREMAGIPEVEFHFIQTMPMEQKRVEMGWAVDVGAYPFVSLFYEDEAACRTLILNSDVTIFGWTEGLTSDLEEERLSSGKLSFRVSERIYREGQWKFISPRGLMRKYKEHIRYRKMPVYLLCAGAYVASDFALIHSYPGKMLKWGYFPNAGSGKAEPEKKREISDDMYRAAVSDTRKLKLLWAGRLIDLKHPEFAVEAAKLLTERGYDFYLDIAGDGNRKDGLNKLIEKYGLSDRVRLLGGKTPTEVLELMHEADIFLFTSNYLEGWGAVVNEAMSEKCCVLASGDAGAVPFLIREGENGLTYPDGNFEEFVNKLIFLFENKKEIVRMALEGKKTIEKLWNPENASKEFIRFCREYFENGNPTPAKEGPMSAAEIIKPAGIARTRQEKNVLE